MNAFDNLPGRKSKYLVALIAGITAATGLIGCGEPALQSQTRFLMDTVCTIQVPGDKRVLPSIGKAFDRMLEVDAKFNALNPDSPVYAFNNRNVPITDKEIAGVVESALAVCEKSGGAFDITLFPVSTAWGFFTDSPHVPAQTDIDRALEGVGYRNLEVVDGVVIKHDERTQIDLGAIAKGYAVQEGLRVLRQEGVDSALIDAGGDIYALGQIDGRLWKIGIKNPRGEGVIGSLEVSDISVVTSGDYERYFEKDGVRYHHIINPKTGYPAQGLASVTVLCKDPTLADGWTTALFVMGVEKGLPLVNADDSLEALMVTTDGTYYSSLNANIQNMKGN